MALRSRSHADDPLRLQARRVQRGLIIYLLVLLLIGIGVLRLALTARRFDRFTVIPPAEPAGGMGEPDNSMDASVVPVSGTAP